VLPPYCPDSHPVNNVLLIYWISPPFFKLYLDVLEERERTFEELMDRYTGEISVANASKTS
jgi:hypothetical protein